ncbi:MAG TPA: PQQ-binding-like beta-propeller repeat protein [Calditrichia bacterium]|nr:PQQ-binding-like beta-propeller repeat protein [Calditrichota bacterium]HQU71247.1 PQQ-binding-like beta-propeller repeat protein [Calditrichia bacterium]HQV32083.1 PQQ-binding-like beta-propeller repeat protein [Calditrichia bacterium]
MPSTKLTHLFAMFLFLWPLFAQDVLQNSEAFRQNWPTWRGPLYTGEAPIGNPPTTWSEAENIAWKRDIPGLGHASPIVWGDLLFVSTAEESNQPGDEETVDGARSSQAIWMRLSGQSKTSDFRMKYRLFAIDVHSGEIRWSDVAIEETPHEGTHQDGTWASNSPITDGEHVFAYFGSRGIFCYTPDGQRVWQTDLGDMQTRNGFGEGSSPALYGEVLVVNWDHEGSSFIVALDKRTGQEKWRRQRDEVTSWSTPIILEVEGRPQVIINATTRTRGYDLNSGEVIWELGGMTTNTIPSPVSANGVVYVMSGFRGNALQAIRLKGAKGDLAGSANLVWSFDRDTPYVPSPLLHNGYLYFLKHNKGILSCFESQSGNAAYEPQRLAGVPNVYASPVAAGGKVYIAGRDGKTMVLQAGGEFTVLATNELNDRFDASPAVKNNTLFLRGHNNLYAIRAASE